jgi:AcrR family transcriptional regulator
VTGVERSMRADAIRSRERVLEAAVELIARDGAGASLEAIARAAGVGSATLHRHFPNRWALLEAIFKDRAAQIAGRADDLLESKTAHPFSAWFAELVEMTSATSGLEAVIEPIDRERSTQPPSCHATIADAGNRLLAKEKADGTMQPDVHIDELMVLAMAISSLPAADARLRLQRITAHGWTAPNNRTP